MIWRWCHQWWKTWALTWWQAWVNNLEWNFLGKMRKKLNKPCHLSHQRVFSVSGCLNEAIKRRRLVNWSNRHCYHKSPKMSGVTDFCDSQPIEVIGTAFLWALFSLPLFPFWPYLVNSSFFRKFLYMPDWVNIYVGYW